MKERQALLGQIRWRARRAWRELDLVLQPFLQIRLGELDDEELAALASLLALDDHELWRLLTGQIQARDPAAARIVAEIAALHRAQI